MQFTGWGAIPQAFDERNERAYHQSDWKKEYAELKELLTPEEWARANISTPNAHYTSPEVIEGIYSGLLRLGFTGGRVLEPAMGPATSLAPCPILCGMKVSSPALNSTA